MSTKRLRTSTVHPPSICKHRTSSNIYDTRVGRPSHRNDDAVFDNAIRPYFTNFPGAICQIEPIVCMQQASKTPWKVAIFLEGPLPARKLRRIGNIVAYFHNKFAGSLNFHTT
jgi:hypothetical protein